MTTDFMEQQPLDSSNLHDECKRILSAINFEASEPVKHTDIEDFILVLPSLLLQLLESEPEKKSKRVHSLIKDFCGKTSLILKDPGIISSSLLVSMLRGISREGITLFREFPLARKEAVMSIINIWATSVEDDVRVVALLAIHGICKKYSSVLESCRKLMYQLYAKSCRSLSAHSLGQASLMLNGLVEIFSLNSQEATKHGVKLLRQLASLLEQATKHPSKESIRKVICWQYVSLLRFWTRLLCLQKDKFSPLMAPFCTIMSALLSFQLSPRYFPFHFHCISCIIELYEHVGVYIPVAATLLKILQYISFQPIYKAEVKKAAYDLVASVKVLRSEVPSKGYLESASEDAQYYLVKYLSLAANSPTFPDLASSIIKNLKSLITGNPKIDRHFKSQIEGHLSKFNQQKKEIEAFCCKEGITPINLATRIVSIPQSCNTLSSYFNNLEHVRTSKRKILSERDIDEKEEVNTSHEKKRNEKATLSKELKVSKDKGLKKIMEKDPSTSSIKRKICDTKLRSSKKAKSSAPPSKKDKKLGSGKKDMDDIVEDFVLED